MSKSWADEEEEPYITLNQTEHANLLNKLKRAEAEIKGSPLPPAEDIMPPSFQEAQHDIQVQQTDPNSPLHSAKSFEELGLTRELLQGIYELGFNRPSKIQESALPIILSNPPQNLIAQAQSGTGKTAAFTLGMLHHCKVQQKEPQALCIAPTRELARQLSDNIKAMGKYTGLEVTLLVKDEPIQPPLRSQVLVGTPGPFLDAIKRRAFDPKKIRVFVLDEADVLFAVTGQLSEQSVRLKKFVSPECQTLLFSATFQPEVRQFATRIVPQPCAQITLKQEELTIDAIQQLYMDCGNTEGKFRVLSDIFSYLSVGQTIIFVSKRVTAIELTERLQKDGHAVSYIFGGQDMTTQERDRVIDDFRDAKIKVLITTNVLARGISILQVMLVINYDLPTELVRGVERADTESYLHRIGRSGRFGRNGIAINLCDGPRSLEHVKQIEKYFKRAIISFPIDRIEDLQQMLEELAGDDVSRNIHK